MKVKQAIATARKLKPCDPGTFDDELLAQFLSEVEGRVQTEVLRLSWADCVRYDAQTDMETELIVSPPHDRFYYLYLMAMIDFGNGEYDKYNNTMTMCDEALNEWARWFQRTHGYGRRGPEDEGVYLSAYAIAVKHGYEGTEEEWTRLYTDAVAAAQGAAGEASAAAGRANEAAGALPGYVAAAESAQAAAEDAAAAAGESAGAAQEAAAAAARDAAAGTEAARRAEAAADAAAANAATAQTAEESTVTAKTEAQAAKEEAEALADEVRENTAQTAENAASSARDAADAAASAATAGESARVAEDAVEKVQAAVGGDFATRSELERAKQDAIDAATEASRPADWTPSAEDVGADPAGSASAVNDLLREHMSDYENPHHLTPDAIGAVAEAEKGAPGGVAELDGDGKVPSEQLPFLNPVVATEGILEVDSDGTLKIEAQLAEVDGGKLVGYATEDYVASAVDTHDSDGTAHTDIRALIASAQDGAAHFKKVPQYTATRLSELSEGDVVALMEGGEAAEYYVAKKDYESALNGPGKTLLVRKSSYGYMAWNTRGVNTYAGSTIDEWLNGEYLALLPENVREAIAETTFYYTPGGGENTVTTLARKAFLLSTAELGLSGDNTEGSKIGVQVYASGWMRSPNTGNTTSAYYWQNYTSPVTETNAIYPAFCVPDELEIYRYTDKSGDVHAEQAYTDVLTDASGAEIYPGCRIATGTYVGTGTYGQNNPTVLNFDFEPWVIFVTCNQDVHAQTRAYLRNTPKDVAYSSDVARYLATFTWNGTTVSFWNADHSLYQNNAQGYVYTYAAIG